MCMEDVRIGRKTMAVETQFAGVGTTFIQVLPASPKRIGIIFCSASGGTLNYSTNTNLQGLGLQLQAQIVPVTLNIRDHGALCKMGWWVKSSTAGQNVTVYEIYLEDE